MLRDVTAWVLTDGKAGDEVQCLGVADALGLSPESRRVAPRAPFVWGMPWGPIDPREGPGRPGSPIRPPYPDILIASGRRAVPYVRAVKRLSRGRTYTVILKDPRSGPRVADLIWTPEHDRLRGDNVLVTLTSPHRISAARLAAARTHPDPRLAPLPRPRVAVLAGGDSRHHRFTPEDVARLVRDLDTLARSGATPMITASRRTPAPLREALRGLAARSGGFFWDGDGENPYLALLALADGVVVTADSANMVGEAAATGVPVLVFEPSGGHPKLAAFIRGLERHGAVRPFTGRLEALTYEPLDSTPVIAAAIEAGFLRHRAARDASAPA
ncbi:mitochondrial fission ELM1 family protein [Salinarimonas soli]|uniref:Nucleoside-diphosphate sugar epimerase n=1 Tax=Salinarimonas soli TaxID=1638099 RepID=A0A5B2VDG8_9HYPH|nr:mitochondrial fission ELM1 family protein [Salinarimonas soli]KAA2236736.1 nucleoside-diphosphate sugar epimerase [Salinarimonas soli]